MSGERGILVCMRITYGLELFSACRYRSIRGKELFFFHSVFFFLP